MNEALQEQLAELLQALTTTIITGGEYAAGQLPELCRQAVLVARVTNTLNCAAATVIVPLLIWVAWRIYRKSLPSSSDFDFDFDDFAPRTVLLGIVVAPLLLWLIMSWSFALRAWLAPHMILLDYATGLVK